MNYMEIYFKYQVFATRLGIAVFVIYALYLFYARLNDK